jgi:urease accessory protein
MTQVVEPIAPTSAASLLQLMWLASPALPVGGFSYSEGLEAAVDAGLVSTETQASQWLQDQLWLGLARSDLPVMSRAFVAWQRDDVARIAQLNEWVAITRESAELRLQTEQMGRSMALWLRNRGGAEARSTSASGGAGNLSDGPAGSSAGNPSVGPAGSRADSPSVGLAGNSAGSLAGASAGSISSRSKATPADPRVEQLAALSPAPTWPVAFALAAEQTGAPLRDALLSFAFSWAENMVQAAIRCVPLGQLSGQRILEALTREIPGAVSFAIDLPDDERQAFTPMLAILSSRHEAQYSRLFRS